MNAFAEITSKAYFCRAKRLKPYRGVVERFIAPVLKTGDRSRGPGVRIPPPLPTIQKVPCVARDFLFSDEPTQTKFEGGENENKKPDPTQEGPGFPKFKTSTCPPQAL